MTIQFVIDCGHGGGRPAYGSSAPGAIGPNGLCEKDVTLELGKRVAAKLGATAILTRSSDANPSLLERVETVRRYAAPVLISLHANSGPRGRSGSETWVHVDASAASHALASSIQHELATLRGPNRGVFAAPLALLHPDRLPRATSACLVEADYLSDPEGERRLGDARSLDQIAQAIAHGARASLGRRWIAAHGLDAQSGGQLQVRRVSDAQGLSARYMADQNLGAVPFYGYMQMGRDITSNRFVVLVWPQGRGVDVDLTIDLFDRDPQQNPAPAPIDTQTARIQLADGQRFGYEYSRLPAVDPIFFRIQFIDYAPAQDSGRYLWTQAYG
jgi:N-acetylmuramoyl-L-alanine amidase